MDRRIEKSKKAIMDALTSLMLEKDFDKITINEIAERANVNRGTVYLHYEDKFDLLNQCIEIHLNQLLTSCMTPQSQEIGQDSPKADMLQIFHYLEQHISFYYILLTNKGTPTFRSQMLHMVQEMISVHLNRQSILLRVNKDFLVQFVASATVGIVEWWIINEMPYPAASMVDQLWQLFEKVELVNPY